MKTTKYEQSKLKELLPKMFFIVSSLPVPIDPLIIFERDIFAVDSKEQLMEYLEDPFRKDDREFIRKNDVKGPFTFDNEEALEQFLLDEHVIGTGIYTHKEVLKLIEL